MRLNDQATRCPACQTVFRVVADQLRVSEGWVRCGRCSNVFNAAEHMVDTETGWARLVEETPAPAHSAPPVDNRRIASGPAHRARQDGPDFDRLSNKIEAAMVRSRDVPPAPPQGNPQPPPAEPPRPWAPSQFRESEFRASRFQASQFHEEPAAAPQGPRPIQPPLPQPAPAADPWTLAPGAGSGQATPSALTFRRPAGGPVPSRSAPPPEPDADDAYEQPLRHVPADDWQPRAARPGTDLDLDLDSSPQTQMLSRPPQAGEASRFDVTRPELDWPPSQDAQPLDGLRAEPRVAPQPSAATKPGFMRRAEREQRWRQPHRRALLLGALAGSALLLVAQATLAYRELVAARFPATRPALESLCAGLGCTVHAARLIESLAVESSGLVRVDKTSQYQLQVTLRNRANLELALPALDVTFTDSRGEVISRKVLLPQDLGSTIDKKPGSHGGTVAAGREVTLQGTLQASGGAPDAVAGYTVELFYP